MSNYEHGNWFCRPADIAEAKEIIERAIASGAVSNPVWSGNGRFYGVFRGVVGHYKVGTEYTIEELRKKFPLPGEQTKWNGEGLPPVGTICTSKCPSGMTVVGEILKHHSDGVCALFLCDDEFTVFWQKEFRVLCSERDQWVYEAQKHCTEFSSNQLGKLYDTIKSGDLKAPEVK